jgi:ABC-type phosphate transport system substrate-binding protein
MKFIYALFPFLLISGLSSAQIRVGGSDLLATHFGAALAEYAEARGLDVTTDFSGSFPGVEGLRSGELDLAIVAVPDGMEVPGGDFRSEYVGAKVLAVVVSTGNPLTQVTLRQLGGVFGESEATNVTRWGQLGLTGEWANRSIVVEAISSDSQSLALDLFRHTVLGSRTIRRNVSQFADIEVIRRRFQQDNNGIALLHLVPSDARGLKILSVARNETDFAQPPGPASVASNEYPLRLPLYLVFAPGKGERLKELLRFIVSEEASQALVASGLMPLPAASRQSLDFDFERL